MRSQLIGLAFRLAIFYIVALGGLIWLGLTYPELREYLPVGGIDDLPRGFLTPDTGAAEPQFRQDRAITLLAAYVGGLLFVLPVIAVYNATRRKSRRSIVEALLLLPAIVTTVVFIVQNSIALAFSLAGIVAAVRFRYSLRNPSDAVFVFASIAIGLAAGVEEVGVGGAGSLAFNATALGLAIARADEAEMRDE